jgi:hypothetical protein
MFEGYIRRVTQKWREWGSHELIGGLIVNLFCKMSRSEIDKRQNINLNSGLDDDGNNKSAAVQNISRIQLNLKCIKLRIRR